MNGHSDKNTIFFDTMQVTINIPEWHGDICLRQLTGAEREEFLERYRKQDHAHAYLLVRSILTDTGEQLFTDSDIWRLDQKSVRIRERLIQTVYEMNGFGEEYREFISERLRTDYERCFWFRLALALGMSVKRAQQEIDAREFVEWMAFYALEPWGERRADLRMGILASVMANLWRGKDSRPFTPEDFMPTFGPPPMPAGPPSDEDIAATQAFFEALTLSVGGQVIDPNGTEQR